MAKKHSFAFWAAFWSISFFLLSGWYVFLQVRNRNFQLAESAISLFPFSQEMKWDMKTLVNIAEYVLQTDGEERTFLILFENNMELRPGGGFIGSFGILKIKDGKVVEFATHDTGNFDGRIPPTTPPPYPMKETLHIDSLKLRDSNYSPDFSENAKQAEMFYYLGNGEEKFDGVVAITTNVLTSFLRVTGPVTVEGYPGEYTADNAVLGLEEQVEKNFEDQGIERGDRKNIMSLLGFEILNRAKDFDLTKKYELFKIVLEDLHKKDIQLYFKDDVVQQYVEAAHWDGRVDTRWQDDYVMAVDANLGAYKSDYYMKRAMDYTIDLSKSKPSAKLSITYTHTATEKSWLTKDYLSYLRVYIPQGGWLVSSSNTSDVRFGDELNKKYFGTIISVKLGETKMMSFEYELPENIKNDWYDLKMQKQPGLNDVPVSVHIIHQDGSREDRDIVLNHDFVLSEKE